MLRRFTKGQVIGFIAVIIIGLLILFITNKIINYVNRPVEKVQNLNLKDDGVNLNVNGNYLTYVEINEKYNDAGATAYVDGINVSDEIITSYYNDGRQISNIDTSTTDTYTVKYEVAANGKSKEVTRVVIVTDDKDPSLIVPETVTITSDQVNGFDVEAGVIATDNAGEASFECENTLSIIPDDYIIKCTGRDSRGNDTTRNRLIKVVNGIEFEKNGKLIINYTDIEKKNYTYMYSLDNGQTWKEASVKETLNVTSGNVIALVLENGNYNMSSTYFIK